MDTHTFASKSDGTIRVLTDAYPPKTLEKLREIKRTYDPDNLFKRNVNISPANLSD